MIELGPHRYGKAAIRLVRVGRDSQPHRLRDLTVAIALEGDFTAAHVLRHISQIDRTAHA